MRSVKAILGLLALFIAALSIAAFILEPMPLINRAIIGSSGLLSAFVTWFSIRTLK